ncbi:MAG: hypothetical protein IKN55_09800 [Oscillospiraceae bacterium]|nr:hypothetical protein [Oscillospiraceae bacterium]
MLYCRIKDEIICLDHVAHIYAADLTMTSGRQKAGIKIQFDFNCGDPKENYTVISFESEDERNRVMDRLQSVLCASKLG